MRGTTIMVSVILGLSIAGFSAHADAATPGAPAPTFERSALPMCVALQEEREVNLEKARTTRDPEIRKLCERMVMEIEEKIKRAC